MEALRELEERLGIIPLNFDNVKERVSKTPSLTPIDNKSVKDFKTELDIDNALSNITNYISGLFNVYKNDGSPKSRDIANCCSQILDKINSDNPNRSEINALLRELNCIIEG